jgi:hypothetical protein
LDHGQELFDDVLVMIPVPLPSEVIIRVGKAFEKTVDRIEADGPSAMTLPAIVPDPVHGHPPKPSPERSLALPVKPGDLTKHDDENLLSQVGRLVAEARDATEPAFDQR